MNSAKMHKNNRGFSGNLVAKTGSKKLLLITKESIVSIV